MKDLEVSEGGGVRVGVSQGGMICPRFLGPSSLTARKSSASSQTRIDHFTPQASQMQIIMSGKAADNDDPNSHDVEAALPRFLALVRDASEILIEHILPFLSGADAAGMIMTHRFLSGQAVAIWRGNLAAPLLGRKEVTAADGRRRENRHRMKTGIS